MLSSVLLIASSTSESSTPWWVYLIYMLTGSLAWKISQKSRARKTRHEDDDCEDDDRAQSDGDGDDDDDDEERYYGRGGSRWSAGMSRRFCRRRRAREIRHPVLLVLGMIVAAFAACILIVVVAHEMGYVQ